MSVLSSHRQLTCVFSFSALQPLARRLESLRQSIETTMSASFSAAVVDALRDDAPHRDERDDEHGGALAPLVGGLCRRRLLSRAVRSMHAPLVARMRQRCVAPLVALLHQLVSSSSSQRSSSAASMPDDLDEQMSAQVALLSSRRALVHFLFASFAV